MQSRRDSSEDHALEFANLGRTPAKVIRYEFAVCLPPYMDFDAADLFVLSAHTKEYGAFIAPDQSIEVERFWIGKLVTDEQWKSVESREKSIVLKGKVYYRDVVNDANEHLTVYCFYFSRDDVAFQKPAQAERNTYT